MTGQRQPIERPAELPLPFSVFVDGDPAPKGSVQRNATRGVRHSKRSIGWHDVLVDAIRLKIRNDRMAELLRGLDRPLPPAPLARDVAVHAEFVLRQPRTNSDSLPHAKRHGDIDKHLRTLLDALTDAGVLADDSFVVEVSAEKRWAGPTERCGVRIVVRRPTPELLREAGAEMIARAFDTTLDELGFIPMADPRGLQNVPGIRPMADLTRIVPGEIVPGEINELSEDGRTTT